MKLDKKCLELNQFLQKEDGTEFTGDEMEEIFDSFIEWMEARNLRGMGAIHYLYDTETTTDHGFHIGG